MLCLCNTCLLYTRVIQKDRVYPILNNTYSLTRLTMQRDFGFIVNRALDDIGSLTQLKAGY